MPKKTNKNYEKWGETINTLKEIGAIGKKEIETREELIEILEKIDAYLVMSDFTIIHELLGKRVRKKKGVFVEMQRYILPIKRAKELMDCEKWIAMREKSYDSSFGDIRKAIGRKSELQLERLIDEGDREMIKVGLNYSEKWIPHSKKTNETDTEKVKQVIQDGVREIIKAEREKEKRRQAAREKIQELDGNN